MDKEKAELFGRKIIESLGLETTDGKVETDRGSKTAIGLGRVVNDLLKETEDQLYYDKLGLYLVFELTLNGYGQQPTDEHLVKLVKVRDLQTLKEFCNEAGLLKYIEEIRSFPNRTTFCDNDFDLIINNTTVFCDENYAIVDEWKNDSYPLKAQCKYVVDESLG